MFRPVLPERCEGADGGRVVAALQEITQALSCRASIYRAFWVVDVDLQLGGKKVLETRVREIQHKARASDEVDEVTNEARSNRIELIDVPSGRWPWASY
jgi:hypothetical protein